MFNIHKNWLIKHIPQTYIETLKSFITYFYWFFLQVILYEVWK